MSVEAAKIVVGEEEMAVLKRIKYLYTQEVIPCLTQNMASFGNVCN